MLASAPGTHKPARTTWSFLLGFFACTPRLFSYQQLVFQGSGPRGSTSTPVPAPADSCRTRILQYCRTFLSLHRHSPHLTKPDVRNLFYSERRRSPEIPLAISTHSLRLSGTRKPGMPITHGLCNSARHTRVGEGARHILHCVRICTSIRTLTRASGPPPRPAQQRPDPDSQPQDQHPQ